MSGLDDTEVAAWIADLVHKSGGSGDLVFVTVDRMLRQDGLVRLTERQILVCRGDSAPASLPAPRVEAESGDAESRQPEPVHLFRFSAVTFNSHRIHYDRPYATSVEGYRELVVHGPVTAAKLAMRAARDGPLKAFSFRAQAPLFAGKPIRLEKTGPNSFLARRCDGVEAVSATADYQ